MRSSLITSTILRMTVLAGLVVSAGCSSQLSLNLPTSFGHSLTGSNDIPLTPDLDRDSTRKLFLIIVDGLRKQGKSRAALAYLDDYNKAYPNDAEAQMLQAECLLDIGDFDRAGTLYTGLRNGPRAAAAYAGLGNVAAAHHDWPQAAVQFAEAARREASNPAYVNDLGFALIHVGQYDRGVARLQEATQLDPASRTARNNLILGLALAGRGSEAAGLLDEIADPKDRERASQLLHVTTAANEPQHGSPPKQE